MGRSVTRTEKPPSAVAEAAPGGLSALAGGSLGKGGQNLDPVTDGVKQILPAGVFMTSDHRYYFNGEGPVPSVTTILEVLSKPALVYWKAAETAKAMFRIQHPSSIWRCDVSAT